MHRTPAPETPPLSSELQAADALDSFPVSHGLPNDEYIPTHDKTLIPNLNVVDLNFLCLLYKQTLFRKQPTAISWRSLMNALRLSSFIELLDPG
jgi:hypothetical protein